MLVKQAGGRGSKLPRHCHPLAVSAEMLRISGRGNCKEAISSPGGKLPSEEIAANPAYTPPGSIKAREGLRFRGGVGASSPATATPTQFPLKCFAFPGAETARKQFLLRGDKLPSEEIAANPAYTPPDSIEAREGCGPLELSRVF